MSHPIKSFVLFAAFATGLAACSPGEQTAAPPPLEGAAIGGPFTLTGEDGQPVSWSDFDGKYRTLYFGYTFCPDVCPVDVGRAMAGLKKFEAASPDRAAKVQPLFVSVDPERDTPAVLREFTDQFHPRLIGMTGSKEQLDKVTKEFAAFATNADRPIAHYLRALARDLNDRTPGKGVGVIGQCFTGGFALAAAVDDSVLAPVMSQPSLPLPLTPKQRRDPGVSDAELKVVEQRAASEGLCVMGLRFSEDAMSPRDRFTTLKNRLGDAFEVIEIDSGKGNPDGIGRMAHSVLTDQVREVDGHPAYEARKRVVEFLTSRLT